MRNWHEKGRKELWIQIDIALTRVKDPPPSTRPTVLATPVAAPPVRPRQTATEQQRRGVEAVVDRKEEGGNYLLRLLRHWLYKNQQCSNYRSSC